MNDWPWMILGVVLELLTKPAFWICVSVLVGANVVAEAVGKAGAQIAGRIERLGRRLRPSANPDDDDDDDFFEDL